jgi:hypothetical protein
MRFNRASLSVFAVSVVFLVSVGQVRAQSSTSSPYLDKLRASIPSEQAVSSDGYSEKLRAEARERAGAEEKGKPDRYTDHLRSTDPELGKTESADGYSKKLQTNALKTPDRKSAIQSVNDGTSALKPRFEKEATRAAGIRFMAAGSRNYAAKSGTGKRKFDQVYGSGWDPDIQVYYEHQLLRSGYGNIGLQGSFGFGIFRGEGAFDYPLFRENGQAFGSPKTQYRFITIPLHVGGRFTLTLGKYVQPYAAVGPLAVAYLESRTDNKSDKWGRSFGYMGQLGANILLDDLTPEFLWDLYAGLGVRHYYVTLDYTRIATPNSDVDFDSNLVSLGFTYEF